MNCPKCDFEQQDGEVECFRCGVIFAKYKSSHKFYSSLTVQPHKSDIQIQDIAKEGWICLLTGLFLAIVVLISPILSFIFHPLLIIIHELGHTFSGWLFGYPALPAFDFVYGGGITIHGEKNIGILALVYLSFSGLFLYYLKNRTTLILLTVCISLYTLFTFTSLHDVFILFMGHGSELILSGVFLYRAISGSSIVHSIERPLYAFAGFFIELSNIRFSYQLSRSEYHRLLYEEEKGGGHWMDFSRIAEEYLNVELSTVSMLFFLCCFLPPVMAFLACRYKRHGSSLIFNLFRRKA
ncbi:MAG TPA: hypothetical protein VHT73_11150 [Thermodesulfobacteriota bacterium]|nr:hypothetical protein [Thermodesulfobacteriota bacterium]